MKPCPAPFDYTLDFKAIDFASSRTCTASARVSRAFKTVAEAKKSSAKIYKMFIPRLASQVSPCFRISPSMGSIER
jgi:hypothetical protein